MSLTTLFDKSFLQSLSIDESVWFDRFFLAVVPPIFFVETLADLHKPPRPGRTPDDEVRIIAEKFPDIQGTPCFFHRNLALANLMGHPVPMTGQIPIAGGRVVRVGDRRAVVHEAFPEAEAFSRWQRGEFEEMERKFARSWRESLTQLPLGEISDAFTRMTISGESSHTLAEAKTAAEQALTDPARAERMLDLASLFLNLAPEERLAIALRWRNAGSPPLATFAPYAAYVLTVELFFQIATSAGLLSRVKPSNRTDIGYLFYLPFCTVFVSSDNFHRRCAVPFLRADQEFVWGQELKQDLVRVNAHFAGLSDEVKEKGLFSFARTPPIEGDFLVAQLWDRHLRNWRISETEDRRLNPEEESGVVAELRRIIDSPEVPMEPGDTEPWDPDAISVERLIRKRKGSWWQVAKDLEDDA